jgi:hypothetical protein
MDFKEKKAATGANASKDEKFMLKNIEKEIELLRKRIESDKNYLNKISNQ